MMGRQSHCLRSEQGQIQHFNARRHTRWAGLAAVAVLACGWVSLGGQGAATAAVQPATQGGGSGRGVAGLEAEIRAVVGDKAMGQNGVAGIAVARVAEGSQTPRFLATHNATTPMIPASNLKVVTTSAALAVLGPDFKFKTSLLLRDSGNGVYDLYLIGDGDPTLADPELNERTGWKFDTVFRHWTAELKKRGISSVRHVYVDDSVFDRQFVHPSWPVNQLEYSYSAQVSGLNFCFNTVEIEVSASGPAVTVTTEPQTSYVRVTSQAKATTRSAVGGNRPSGGNEIVVRGEVPKGATERFSMTVHDPALYGATVLAETLIREGITVTGGVGRDLEARATAEAQPAAFQSVGVLQTPLSVVLHRTNKDSANLYAESLAKRLAFKAIGQPGSWEGSRATVGAWLERLGVPKTQFTLDDGCGLSRNNRISAEGMVKILAYDFGASYRQTMLDSMAVGGMDGTLSKRFDNHLKGRVFAKTGFINQVSTLSGFLKARDGNWYAFSILMNNVSGVRGLHQRIVEAIDQHLP